MDRAHAWSAHLVEEFARAALFLRLEVERRDPLLALERLERMPEEIEHRLVGEQEAAVVAVAAERDRTKKETVPQHHLKVDVCVDGTPWDSLEWHGRLRAPT